MIEGSNNTLSAPSPQTLGGTSYGWVSWSDGGAQSHNVVASAAVTYTATYQAAGSALAAAYSFDEGVGTSAADASGNGNTGAIGSAARITTGKYGNALSFNGTSARVTVADSASLDLTTAMTLEAWVFPTVGGGWRDVIYKGPDDTYYLEGSSDSGAPAAGGTFSGPLYRDLGAAAEHLVAPRRDLRRHDLAAVRERRAGVESGCVRADRHLDRGVDDRW